MVPFVGCVGGVTNQGTFDLCHLLLRKCSIINCIRCQAYRGLSQKDPGQDTHQESAK